MPGRTAPGSPTPASRCRRSPGWPAVHRRTASCTGTSASPSPPSRTCWPRHDPPDGPSTILRHRATVAAVELDGEVLLYDGMYLRRLPALEALRWELVDGHRPAGQIAALVPAGRSEPEVSQVTEGVVAYLSDLHDLMVLELGKLDRTTYRRPPEVGWVRRPGRVARQRAGRPPPGAAPAGRPGLGAGLRGRERREGRRHVA